VNPLPMDQIAVWLLIGAAALYLFWRYGVKRRKSGCDDCSSGCGTSPVAAKNGKPSGGLVQLELTPPRPKPADPSSDN